MRECSYRADSENSSSLLTQTRRDPSDVGLGNSTSKYPPSLATGHPTVNLLLEIDVGSTIKSCGPSRVSTETNNSLGWRPSPSDFTLNRIISRTSPSSSQSNTRNESISTL